MQVKGQLQGQAAESGSNALTNSAATIRDYDNRHFLHPWEAMASLGHADRTISVPAACGARR